VLLIGWIALGLSPLLRLIERLAMVSSFPV